MVRPLFTRTAVWIIALLGIAGLYLVSRQWEQFTGTFQFMLSWQGAALYFGSLVVVKSIHELGHAYMSVKYGLRVPTIGVAFMVLMPVLLKNIMVGQFGWPTDLAAHFEFVIVGLLIVVFLILEPHGLAQLWRLAKEKLRLWPFPH